MKRAVLSVVGKDSVGIIAKVCTYLASKNINILDISQTIVDGFFNMMMVIDITNVNDEFTAIIDEIRSVGEEVGVTINVQREEIFDQMHRL
ncbi:MAG: ACT domain-containing protein [Catonella sp.]|jgi:ACT domain-containing protein|nr:ACT domain-containing protein [Catonella sp.]MDY6356891.1 ACT domain-containing protein [Catonella sp.]